MSELPDDRMDSAIEYLRVRKKQLLDEVHKIDEVIRAVEASHKR